MIPFNIPYISGKEEQYIREAIQEKNLAGDGYFTKKNQKFLEKLTNSPGVLLTSSCTHALELAALLCEIQPGDEVIMPSFTFVSSANAFVLRGARIVFVDIRPDTMNIDEKLIESAISEKTKAILVMHYAGVACAMNEIMAIADQYKLFVVEDAAQCVDAYYNQKHLGTIGHIGTFSFHSTKNIHCGEGGALLINDERLIERAEIIREKGTNRKSFLRGEVDKYSWVDIGSSYLMSELNAAFLYAQLLAIKEISKKRIGLWNRYNEKLNLLKGLISMSEIPLGCQHNGHIFSIKCKNQSERFRLITHLKKQRISAFFHYVPLHTSEAGKRFSRFNGLCVHTRKESEKLLRLPLYPDLEEEQLDYIAAEIINFYN
ncbi:MAG: dTDP-4-amino-4,6-dideoxygalactose transaminase [Ulvibacter sp.]|jgi:dTDP-4-amino-4,6-dideoxygalactose transaminase